MMGDGYDNKADVWSVGVCVYEMISFEKPFSIPGQIIKYTMNKFNYTPLPNNNHPQLVPLVNQMLSKDPEHRPSSVDISKKISDLRKSKTEKQQSFPDLYIKLDKLGKGGFGSVFQVTDKLTNETLAMKEIETDKLRPDLLKAEIDVLRDCVHENIVRYHHHIFEKDTVYILMELCPRGDLRAAIVAQKKTGQFFSEEQLLSWFFQMFNGTVYLHIKKIIHRDIKPRNILISAEGTIKLTDFGLSKIQGKRY